MKVHKITLRPEIKLEIEFDIRADTKADAQSKGEAYIVQAICEAFGCDPSTAKIKFS